MPRLPAAANFQWLTLDLPFRELLSVNDFISVQVSYIMSGSANTVAEALPDPDSVRGSGNVQNSHANCKVAVSSLAQSS